MAKLCKDSLKTVFGTLSKSIENTVWQQQQQQQASRHSRNKANTFSAKAFFASIARMIRRRSPKRASHMGRPGKR